jgi:hypothetical protein
VRGGFGQPSDPFWVQLIAGTSKNLGVPDSGSAASDPDGIPAVSDTTRGGSLAVANTHSRAQWIATGGVSAAGASLSLTGRYRVYEGRHLLSPSLRASVDRGWLAASLFAERFKADSLRRSPRRGLAADSLRSADIIDATVRLTPLSFLSIAGAAGRRTESGGGVDSVTSNYYRGEVGVRLGSVWLSGGVMGRDTAVLRAPGIFGERFTTVHEGPSVGQFAAIRGRLWKDVFADVQGSMWNQDTLRYRPRYQARSEVYVRTNWRRKFPSGNFGLLFSVRHDFRSNVRFPTVDAAASTQSPTLIPEWETSQQNRVISTLLEIRIVNAVITWQYRNLLGEEFNQIPGFRMPNQVNLYGVRWDFWN